MSSLGSLRARPRPAQAGSLIIFHGSHLSHRCHHLRDTSVHLARTAGENLPHPAAAHSTHQRRPGPGRRTDERPNTAPFQQAPLSQGPVSPDFEAPVKLDSPKTSIIESEESYYIFTSEGGLKAVELKKPHVVLGDNVDLLWDTNNGDVDSKPIILNHGVELPVFALKGIDDSEFSITADDSLVTMVSTNKAGIRITKKFNVGTNYLLHSTITLANPMTEPVALPRWKLMLGTSMPLQSEESYPVWGAQWHNGEDMQDIDESWFTNSTLGCFPGTPRTEFRSAGQPIKWVGIHNRFFAMTTMPDPEMSTGALSDARVYSKKTTNHRLPNEPQDEHEQYRQ